LALELVLKAILIAKNPGAQPTFTHQLCELWQEAGLAQPSNEDQRWLRLLTESLYWLARYPAAKRTCDEEAAFAALADLRNPAVPDVVSDAIRKRLLRAIPWDDFDRLYRRADAHLARLMDLTNQGG